MTILDRIVADKREEAARLPSPDSLAEALASAVAARGGVRTFRQALEHPRIGNMGLIAEVKKASPSAGVICADFDPVRIARGYERGGASCLSVLTDRKYFQGSLEDLRRIRAAVGLPLLRKDFIIDERQILEAVEWGADAILLIVAILDDRDLRRLHELAAGAGLSVLVEVHDESELELAVRAGAELIGINNRNLRDFSVDLVTSERLGRMVSRWPGRERRLLVSESGIRTRQDVQRLSQVGVQALLVGESLMRQGDSVAEAIAGLVA